MIRAILTAALVAVCMATAFIVVGAVADLISDVWAARRHRRWLADTDLALEVCRSRHPSRWGSGPVPVEDSPDWGAS